MTDRTALNGPWLFQCIRCSYVCQRNTEKCSDRKAPPTRSELTQQRSLVKRRKQNLARNRYVITSQTCQDKVKRWVTADFVNVSRRVSVNCKSTFCSDVYLDYFVAAASLNNSEELHIRNFKPQTCVRRPQSLKCFKMAEDIENWPTSGMSCLTNTKDPKAIKR